MSVIDNNPQPSDMVVLASGGPPMMVTDVHRETDLIMVECIWFDADDRVRQYTFNARWLYKIDPAVEDEQEEPEEAGTLN